MKDERIAEIAWNAGDTCNFYADGFCAKHSHCETSGVCKGGIESVIRLALAERDREVVEWVKTHTILHVCDDYYVIHPEDLLAFLESEKP